MQSNNEAEIAITMTAKDEASEEMANVRDEAQGMNKDFGGLSKSMVATTLGFFGMSFGVMKAVDALQDSRDHVLGIDSAIAVLGPNAKDSMEKFEPAIGTISDIVKEADEDVRKALQNILTGSGGIEPTAQDIVTAFAVASGFGVPVEEAASAIGQALGGIMDGINAIVDPSDRNPVDSLEELYGDLVGVFVDSRSTTDEITAAWNELWNAVTGKNSGASGQGRSVIITQPEIPTLLMDPNSPAGQRTQEKSIQDIWGPLIDALGLDVTDPTAEMTRAAMQRQAGQTVTPPGSGTDAFGNPIINTIYPGGNSSAANGGLGVIININATTTEERRQQILDEVTRELDEALRRHGGLDGSLGR